MNARHWKTCDFNHVEHLSIQFKSEQQLQRVPSNLTNEKATSQALNYESLVDLGFPNVIPFSEVYLFLNYKFQKWEKPLCVISYRNRSQKGKHLFIFSKTLPNIINNKIK